MSNKYVPRNDFVILRLVDGNASKGGVALPETSREGHKWYVVAFGPNVSGMEVGDRVLVIGTLGQDVILLPAERKLFTTKEANVLLVIKEDQGECT